MVQTIKKVKEYYKCGECGMQYEDKGWAEKCEAWCKEHHSCHIEITSHAVPKDETPENDTDKIKDTKFNTRLFYGLISIAASLAFFLLLYWSLRTNSSIASLIGNTYGKPFYFWPYVIMTFASIILFGINAALFVYRWRKFGLPKLKKQGATGGGSLVAVVASACPICGSTLLAAIGIAGGLAAFPLGGLELKALSVVLLALPIWLTRRDLKKLESDCANGVCPVPQDHSFKEKDRPWLLGLVIAVIVLALTSWSMLKTDPALASFVAGENNIFSFKSKDTKLTNANVATTNNPVFDAVVAKVIPEKGFQSKIVLGDSIVRLVENGVIDREKFLAIYRDRGDLPPELSNVLDKQSSKPILLTRTNSNYYVNLLWPVGLANYMESNKRSPVNGKSLFNFASTGGWNLGKEKNGGAYFNKFKIVELMPDQEALVTKIAENTYRPCCNNSTFFQDCNHGSALLGLLQLGAAQGLTEDELYREALAFNSFWFPQNYIQTALYFKSVKNIDWENVNPKEILGYNYSSASGYQNILSQVAPPSNNGGQGCGI